MATSVPGTPTADSLPHPMRTHSSSSKDIRAPDCPIPTDYTGYVPFFDAVKALGTPDTEEQDTPDQFCPSGSGRDAIPGHVMEYVEGQYMISQLESDETHSEAKRMVGLRAAGYGITSASRGTVGEDLQSCYQLADISGQLRDFHAYDVVHCDVGCRNLRLSPTGSSERYRYEFVYLDWSNAKSASREPWRAGGAEMRAFRSMTGDLMLVWDRTDSGLWMYDGEGSRLWEALQLTEKPPWVNDAKAKEAERERLQQQALDDQRPEPSTASDASSSRPLRRLFFESD